MATVVLISGKAESGKDTFAEFFAQSARKEGKTCLIAHYGDLVKFVATKWAGWSGLKDETGRQLLQYIGTDLIRAKYPNYWVRFVKQMVGFFGDVYDYILIPDCRFPNEVRGWKHAPGVDQLCAVRIERPHHQNKLTEEQRKHPSETALDNYSNFDYVVFNADTLETLRKKAENLRHELRDRTYNYFY